MQFTFLKKIECVGSVQNRKLMQIPKKNTHPTTGLPPRSVIVTSHYLAQAKIKSGNTFNI